MFKRKFEQFKVHFSLYASFTLTFQEKTLHIVHTTVHFTQTHTHTHTHTECIREFFLS